MLLYLHIPFCDSKCHYCAFNSYVDKFEQKQSYMIAIVKQLEFELKRFNASPNSIETIFIGGGTPSTIDPKLYKPFFDILKPFIIQNVEITTEANPNSATKDWLEGMAKLGVNRVSFGVQSFNDEKLKLLGRNHTSQMAKQAVTSAKDIGFKNISLDLIYGTLVDNKEILTNDLDTAFKLPINHLSAYSLIIEENTAFFKKPEVQNDDENLAFWFTKEIQLRGLPQYEISNFGTYKSKHNIGYWQHKDYIGVGSGAVGFLKNRRFYPSTTIESYIANPLDNSIEELTAQDIKEEKVLLGLRSEVGINKSILNPKQIKSSMYLVEKSKLIYKDMYFYNSDYFLSDEIALYILG